MSTVESICIKDVLSIVSTPRVSNKKNYISSMSANENNKKRPASDMFISFESPLIEQNDSSEMQKARKTDLVQTLKKLKNENEGHVKRREQSLVKVVGLWNQYERALEKLSKTADLNDAKEKGMFLLK